MADWKKLFSRGLNPLLMEDPDVFIWLCGEAAPTVQAVMARYPVDEATAARWLRLFAWELTDEEQARATAAYQQLRRDRGI